MMARPLQAPSTSPSPGTMGGAGGSGASSAAQQQQVSRHRKNKKGGTKAKLPPASPASPVAELATHGRGGGSASKAVGGSTAQGANGNMASTSVSAGRAEAATAAADDDGPANEGSVTPSTLPTPSACVGSASSVVLMAGGHQLAGPLPSTTICADGLVLAGGCDHVADAMQPLPEVSGSRVADNATVTQPAKSGLASSSPAPTKKQSLQVHHQPVLQQQQHHHPRQQADGRRANRPARRAAADYEDAYLDEF